MNSYEIIIVGAGIAGLYCNYKLQKKYKKKNIVIIEASENSGGRIKSVNHEFTYGKNTIEAGANRISSNHKSALKLINELHLQKYLVNGYMTKYNILDIIFNYAKKKEKNQLINTTLRKIINEINNSEVELNKLYEEYGYNSIIENMNAYDAINYIKNSHGKYFYTMKNGLSSIIKKLEKTANIKFNVQLTNIKYLDSNHFQVSTNSKTFYAENLIICIPKEQIVKIPYLKDIYITQNKKKYYIKNIVTENKYIRLYISFKKDENGKFWYEDVIDDVFVSNTHIRQLITTSKSTGVLQIYCNEKSAIYWRDSYTKGTIKNDIHKSLCKLFPQKKIPLPDKIYPFYWRSGTHFWKENIDSEYLSKKIIQPLKSKNIDNLFIVGESYSLCQAWMEGALQTVDKILPILSNYRKNVRKIVTSNEKKTKKKSIIKFKKNTYTLSEVAKHNKKNDAWMIYENKVYDITKWIPNHPGGEIIMQGVGKDATQLFNLYNHPEYAKKLLYSFKIGNLRT